MSVAESYETHESGIDLTANDAQVTALLRILQGAIKARASDVHLRADQPPLVRIDGELLALDHPKLDNSFVLNSLQALGSWADLQPQQIGARQVEFSVEVPRASRFRVHAYRQRRSQALVLRWIPSPIPEFADLRLPAVLKPIALEQRGLVVVSGATGNGKSTTIAAMLQYMNKQVARHIVTLEHPIEFLFEGDLCSFSQREIGVDVDSFEVGLTASLREDPDVIFVGEVRTPEAFEVALSAAEAGHLVVTTLHSTDVMSAIMRMIHFYPAERQNAARQRIAEATAAVVAQRLLPTRGGQGRVAITEVLRKTPTVTECIREASRFRGLPQALDSDFHEYGTHSLDTVLLKLVRGGVIDAEVARGAARSPKDLVRQLKGLGR